MSEIAPPPNVQQIHTAISSAQQITVSVPKTALPVTQFPVGSELNATVLSAAQKGVASIQVGNNVIDLKTPVPLPVDSSVALKVINTDVNGNLLLRVVSIDGRPPMGQMSSQNMQGLQQNSLLSSGAKGSTVSPNVMQGQQQTQSLNIGNVDASAKVTFSQGAGTGATVISGSSSSNIPNMTQIGQGQQLPTGTSLTVKLVDVQLPSSPQMAVETQQEGVIKGQQNLPNTSQQTADNTKILMPSENSSEKTVTVKGQDVSAIKTAGKNFIPSGKMAGNIPQQTITGTVSSNTINGQPVVNTPVGTIAVATNASLPAGTTVTLGIVEVSPPPSVISSSSLPPLVAQGSGWPALDDAVQLLQKTDPAMAERINSLIPQTGSKMAANMIAYAGALQTGDIKMWLGNGPLKSLNKAGSNGIDAARKLEKEFKDLSNRSRKAGDVRSISMPVAGGEGIQAINMVIRRNHDGETDEEQYKRNKMMGGSRFLLNFELSKLGAMQLDGLVYEKERKLDLIMRSEKILADDVQMNIWGIFTGSLEAVNYSGNISFVVTEDFAELSKDESQVHHGSGVWV